MTAIRSRRPTGTIPWPLILLEGPEKSGKTYSAAEFTASDKIGQAYWLDIGEGAADEYAAIPGTRYEVIEHDGTWAAIIGQVAAVRDEAARAAKAGEKPVVLIVDSMTAEWNLLKDWTGHRARNSRSGKAQLARDPDAEIKPAPNFWNDANDRHRHLMHLLMTFPGIVLVTARGKEVASMDANGQPIPNTKEHKVEGQKDLAYDVTAWVSLSRDEHPKVMGVRSIHAGIRPGVDRAKVSPQFTVEWLIFDVMKCDPSAAHVRDHVPTDATEFVEPDYVAVEEWAAVHTDIPALQAAWKRMNAVNTERAVQACAAIQARAEALEKPEPTPEEAQQVIQDQLGGVPA